MSKKSKPFFKQAELIQVPPATHVWGTMVRQWVTMEDLKKMYEEQDSVEKTKEE